MISRKMTMRAVYAVCGVAAVGGLAYAAGPLATGRFSAGQARLYGGAMNRTQAGELLGRAIGAADAALELGLTAEQRTQLKPIIARTAMALRQVRMSDAAPEARHARAKAAIDSALQSARGVLSGEQMARVEAFRARIEDIGITPEQRAQLQPIATDARAAALAVRGDATLKPEEKQARLAGIVSQARRDAGTVLTPEQMAKIRAIRDDKYLVNIIGYALDLTDAQKGAVQEALHDTLTQADQVQADSSLSPAQRLSQLKEIHGATRSRIEASLTPEQIKKAEALRAQFEQIRQLRQQGAGTGRRGGSRLRG